MVSKKSDKPVYSQLNVLVQLNKVRPIPDIRLPFKYRMLGECLLISS